MKIGEHLIYKVDHHLYEVKNICPKNLLTIGSPIVVSLYCFDTGKISKMGYNYRLENGVYISNKTDTHSIYWGKFYQINIDKILSIDLDIDVVPGDVFMVGKKTITIDSIDRGRDIVRYIVKLDSNVARMSIGLKKFNRMCYTKHWTKIN